MNTNIIPLKDNFGNSFKDYYYENVENKKEINELEHLYNVMCKFPEIPFCLDHIDLIFGKTNISSRLFRKLEVNGLVRDIGGRINKNNVNVKHYEIVDVNKRFSIKKEIKLNKEIRDIEKDIHKIVRFCINPEIEYNNKNKIMRMTMDIINYLGKGEDISEIRIINLFDTEHKRIEAERFLEKMIRFVENYRS